MSDLRDIATFAERVLRRPLWAHQLEAAREGKFITAIAKARRTGGTALAEARATHVAFSNRDCKVLILSATQDAARRLTESIGATLARSELTRGAVVEDYATRIILKNGSEIISLPASARQVRGYGERVLLVVLDEAGFMPSELWTAAHYTALDERRNGSQILMLGTPWGGADHFFRRAFETGRDNDADHAAFHWRAEVNPNLDRDYLERMRSRVSPAEYHAEVMGEWSDAVGSLFPRALLERQTADLELPEPAALVGDARPIIGVDWGVSFDRSAAALVYRLPVANLNAGEPLSRFVVVPHVWPQSTPLSDVVADVAAWDIPFGYLAPEVSGVGAMPAQELEKAIRGGEGHRSWCLVATTSPKKTAGYGAILALLERGRLVLPRHPELLRQLAGLKFEQGERGFTRIEPEAPAMHDDVADALMLAALPYSPGRGARVLCGLSQLADPRRPIPDTDVPPLDEEIVETGGGLRVYRRPPLQSVDGRELTMPAGVGYRDPRADEHDRLRTQIQQHLQKGATNG